MQIKEATEGDTPGILEVLKASLGEISSRKTEDVWDFKHVSNPFGKSLVLIALEGNKIIGVRAFMRWQWQLGDKIYSTYRAVDTATHPDYQGKGVFKKLTLKAIDLAKIEGADFIFNTPNEQSLPGYLKMGWERVKKLKVQIIPTYIVFRSSEDKKKYQQDFAIDGKGLDTLCFQNNLESKNMKLIFTPKSVEYLRWRYEDNPLQEYEIFADDEHYVAGYIKQHTYFKELRIVEILLGENGKYNKITSLTHRWAKKYGAHFISIANKDNLGKIKLKGHYGPVLTVRNLTLVEKNYEGLLHLQNYNYSLGDLELF